MYSLPGKLVRNGTVTQWEFFSEKELESSINVVHANIANVGTSLEPHAHDSEEQIFFILGGVGVMKVGEEEAEVREGDAIYLPPRLAHSIKNTGTYPLRFLAFGARILKPVG